MKSLGWQENRHQKVYGGALHLWSGWGALHLCSGARHSEIWTNITVL